MISNAFITLQILLLALLPISIHSQVPVLYQYQWNDTTKTITFTTIDTGSGTFTGKFMKATPLASSRLIAGKYREPVTTGTNTIDILIFDITNMPTFIGSFSFLTNVSGSQVAQLPVAQALALQNGVSAVLAAGLPNPPTSLFTLLQNSNIEADPTTTKVMTVRIFNYSEFVLDVAVASSSQLTQFTPSASTIAIQGYINMVIEFVVGNTTQQGVLNVSKSGDSSKLFQIKASCCIK